MTVHVLPCGCRVVEIVANRAERRRLQRLTGRAPATMRAHADHCVLGGVERPPGHTVAGKIRSSLRQEGR